MLNKNEINSFDYIFKDISLIKGKYTIENYFIKLSHLYDYNGICPVTTLGNLYYIIRTTLDLTILGDINNVYKLVSFEVYNNHHFLVTYQIYIEKNKLTNSLILKENILIIYNRYKQIRNRPCNTKSKINFINPVFELTEEDEIKWMNAYIEENHFNVDLNEFYDSF